MELENQNDVREQTEEDYRLTDSFLGDLKEFMDSKEVEALNINTEEPIMTREQAGFYMRKLAEIREQNEKINATADGEIARLSAQINAWRDQELAKNANVEGHFMRLLEAFTLGELAGTDKKSVKLPYGTVGFRSQQDAFEYDDKALLEHLEDLQAEGFIARKASPDKSYLKKQATVKDGRLFLGDVELRGVSVTKRDDTFYVK